MACLKACLMCSTLNKGETDDLDEEQRGGGRISTVTARELDGVGANVHQFCIIGQYQALR